MDERYTFAICSRIGTKPALWRIYNYSVCYERFQERFSAVWSNAAHLTVLLIAIRNEHPRRAELPDNSQLRGGDV